MIGRVKGTREIVHQVQGAGVAMRLKQHVKRCGRPISPRPEWPDFGGVVPVIVDHRDTALLAPHLETPAHAGEFLQSFAHYIRLHAQFERTAMAAVAFSTL